jgi:hypothetical protein
MHLTVPDIKLGVESSERDEMVHHPLFIFQTDLSENESNVTPNKESTCN